MYMPPNQNLDSSIVLPIIHKVLRRKGDGKKEPSAILGTNVGDQVLVYSGNYYISELHSTEES